MLLNFERKIKNITSKKNNSKITKYFPYISGLILLVLVLLYFLDPIWLETANLIGGALNCIMFVFVSKSEY